MNEIQELTEDHLRSIEFREIERSDLGDTLSAESIQYFMSSQFKKAVLVEGKVVMALGGVIENNECRTWLIGSELINENPVASFESIMEIENEAMRSFPEVKTLFTYNSSEFPFAIKFLKRIGYQEIGLEGGFNDGKERILLIKGVN